LRKLAAFMLFLVFLAGAQAVPAVAAPFKTNSGKTLEILAIKPEKTGAGASLVLHYATPLPLADLKGLRREADELWEHFSANAEAAKATRAVVRATQPKKPETTVDFIYVKRNGIWHTVENGLNNGKLTKQFIQDAHEHQQWIHKHKNYNAILLYLGNDWTVSYNYPPEMRIGRQTFDRRRMIFLLEQLRQKINQRQTKVDITGIQISPDGKSATVSTRLSGETEMNGQIMNMSGEGQDFIVVRDGTVVSIRSIATIEKFSVAIEQ
jgi:hypothetical protein